MAAANPFSAADDFTPNRVPTIDNSRNPPKEECRARVSGPSAPSATNPCRHSSPVPVTAASRFPSPKGPLPISFVDLPSAWLTKLRSICRAASSISLKEAYLLQFILWHSTHSFFPP
ncbi:hypothetical protein AAHE18_20G026400 [Arachis hypogaea]|uniref:Uncharacterized protein n=1 Tax=Arachis hypogaea TaxID=3818 RepID=A0A444WX57_ARAHY|nr:hypothetical protein Ahy_B10g100591 isoform A [Arachis hypogaea]